MQIRRTKNMTPTYKYANLPVVRLTGSGKFIISKLIPQALGMDTETESLMFGIDDDKITIFKEQKAVDNYHLGYYDTNTYRFTSKELRKFICSVLSIPENKSFHLQLQFKNK